MNQSTARSIAAVAGIVAVVGLQVVDGVSKEITLVSLVAISALGGVDLVERLWGRGRQE
jgi:hypothetical protein